MKFISKTCLVSVATLAMLASLGAATAFAQTETVTVHQNQYSSALSTKAIDADDVIVARQAIKAAATDCSSYVKFSKSQGISVDEFESAFNYEYIKDPDIFWWSSVEDYEYVYDSKSAITKVTGLTYKYSKSTVTSMIAKQDAAVATALTWVDPNTMTTVQMCQALHDYLVRIDSYDNKAAKSDDDSNTNAYTAYGALVDHKCVCEGYTMAYILLLDKVGIVSQRCDSNKMDHVWNWVLIDGNWYHVDVTWDDMGGGFSKGKQVCHDYFLKSDAVMRAKDSDGEYHCGWKATHTASSSYPISKYFLFDGPFTGGSGDIAQVGEWYSLGGQFYEIASASTASWVGCTDMNMTSANIAGGFAVGSQTFAVTTANLSKAINVSKVKRLTIGANVNRIVGKLGWKWKKCTKLVIKSPYLTKANIKSLVYYNYLKSYSFSGLSSATVQKYKRWIRAYW